MIACLAALAGCGEPEPSVPGRWYSERQVAAGAAVFAAHCAECHGGRAQGAPGDWRRRLDDGGFPPPPLDGSAHAWHHPLSVLLAVIDDGGEALGGRMPGFGRTLGEAERLAAVAYFQSFWDEATYGDWERMGGVD